MAVEATKKNLWDALDEQVEDSGGEFERIPDGTYQWDLTAIKNIARDSKGTMRCRLEFTISGIVKDGVVYTEDEFGQLKFIGRKNWDGGALEGPQIHYFLTKYIKALGARWPENRDALADLPNVNVDDFTATVQPDEADGAFDEYFRYIMDAGLNVIATLKFKGKDSNGYDKFSMFFSADQSARE